MVIKTALKSRMTSHSFVLMQEENICLISVLKRAVIISAIQDIWISVIYTTVKLDICLKILYENELFIIAGGFPSNLDIMFKLPAISKKSRKLSEKYLQ